MKKLLFHSIFFVGLGFLIGNILFQNRMILGKQRDIYYFLEEGVYVNQEGIPNHLTPKVVNYEDNRYYVYVGITKEKEVAEKIKEIYKEKGYLVSIKEKIIPSREFLENVSQFDLLVENAKTEEEILKIEEVILANYHELSKRT